MATQTPVLPAAPAIAVQRRRRSGRAGGRRAEAGAIEGRELLRFPPFGVCTAGRPVRYSQL